MNRARTAHEPRGDFYGLKNYVYVPVEKVSLHENILDRGSTIPRTGGPRGSTYSRMSVPPPEQVDPHLLGYGSLARGPDGWSAGPVTSLGRARVRG